MRIKKEKVKQLIIKFQKDFNVEILKQIIKETSDMVYNYPSVVFHIRKEDCGDFYIYFIERIKSLISKYDPALSSFYTWFNIILKSQCLNWLNRVQRKKGKSIQTESLDNSLQYLMQIEELDDPVERNYDNISLIINQYIENSPVLEYLIIKLLYYNIDNKLLNKLSAYNKRSSEENIELIKQLLNNNRKFQIQSRTMPVISVLQYKILELRKKIVSPDIKEKINFKIRLKRHLSNLKLLKRRLNNNLENLDIRSIAVILNEKENEIYYKLKKIRRGLFLRLKNKIE